MFTTFCLECDANVGIGVYGEYIRATLETPAEYPEAELENRECITTGEDACTLTDEEVTDNAYTVWDNYDPTE